MTLTRLPVIPTIITLVAVVIMFSLGFWQLDRKAQKNERLTQIEMRQADESSTLDDVLSAPAEYEDFPVRVRGEILSRPIFFIDNKIHEGQVGYHVVSIIDNGQHASVLNLGWVRGLGSRDTLPPIDLPNESEMLGIVSTPRINPMVQETNLKSDQGDVLLQQLDIEIIKTHLRQQNLQDVAARLQNFVLLASPNASSFYVREWQPVVMAPEKHLGYAIQWFGLAIACLTIYLLSVMRLTAPQSIQKKD